MEADTFEDYFREYVEDQLAIAVPLAPPLALDAASVGSSLLRRAPTLVR